MSVWRFVLDRISRRQAGQGVIEYGGALVIAAVLIGASIFVVPPMFAGFVNSVYVAMQSFLTGQMPR